MDPQIDTAQRRAEAVNRILSMYQLESVRAGYRVAVQAAICRELQQARREALEEAAKVARDRALLWKSHGGTKMASPYSHLTVEGECEVIAGELDRLREGEKA